ncbi:MAG: BaiN/RdsA family NAD(P)/FAD-dependent oxidoreductase [Leptospirales bacterium]
MNNDVVILGAGAAGMMCAIAAGRRGRRVVLLDHTRKLAPKIRISGGGRCNFTNINLGPEHFISENPDFCRSALARFTPSDFLSYLRNHSICWHEKKLGQLFCDTSSAAVIDMLKQECLESGVEFRLGHEVSDVRREWLNGVGQFVLETNGGVFCAPSLVVASGGLSVPEIGASPIGYKIAEKFGIRVTRLKPGLVPLTVGSGFPELSGMSVDCTASCNGMSFRESALFTHRGMSGPAILQISSYWNPDDEIELDLLPHLPGSSWLDATEKVLLSNFLSRSLPRKLAQYCCRTFLTDKPLNRHSQKEIAAVAEKLHAFRIRPSGTEGYRKAEVTVGGVSTHELSSKTMESRTVPGLYFIGEVVDVTGQLGGYNFQWAWSSGFAAGQHA